MAGARNVMVGIKAADGKHHMDSQNRVVGHAGKRHNDADSIAAKEHKRRKGLNRERRGTRET